MATFYSSTPFPVQFQDDNGDPADNYVLHAFLNGTSTPTNMFTDSAGTIAGTTINLDEYGYPVVSGSRTVIWLDQKITYKFELRDATDVTVVWTSNQISKFSGQNIVIYEDTIASMTANSALMVGDVVKTIEAVATYGYEGGNEFLVGAAGSFGTADGFSIVDLPAVSLQAKALFSDGVYSIERFGGKGDGITSDSIAIANAWVASGYNPYFYGHKTYLLTDIGGRVYSVFGRVICDAESISGALLDGNGCTIKISNQDVTANGLRFANFKGCKNPVVRGFNFDMTFTGVNTSSAKYPFCGALTFLDDATGVQTQADLNTDIHVSECSFKIFHTFGAFSQSGAAYLGDGNNGYKLFSIFASGDSSATAYANQNRGCTIVDCKTNDGHNGYGFWVWAFNNVKFIRPSAENFVTKYSSPTGVYVGSTIPFIRYHQFYCRDVDVIDINFKGKPCSERTTSGFEGAGNAIGFNTNLSAGGLDGGVMRVSGGTIVGGNGDSANTQLDALIFCDAYGSLIVDGTYIDGISDTTNAEGGTCISYSPEVSGGTGNGECHVVSVNFGRELSYYNNIAFSNGAPTAAGRRCKLLTTRNCTSLSQLQYFLDMKAGSSATVKGCANTQIENVYIDGLNNTVFPPANTNSRGFLLAGGDPGDVVTGDNIVISNKNIEILTSDIDASATFEMKGYKSISTTTRFSGSKLAVMEMTGSGTPEGVEAADIGSTFKRKDGGAGTSFYVKEGVTTSTTDWVAK